jgi:hypothetical protein
MKRLFLSLFVGIALASCTPSTLLVKSWSDPVATVTPGPGNKTLILAMVKDEGSRRIIEDELAKRMKGSAVVSYSFLVPEILNQANVDYLAQKLKEGNYTHVLMMRLANVEEETSYVPGTTSVYYGGYGRYYSYGAGYYTNPGYYTTDKNYFVETTVFSVEPDKLLWTGTTKTVNPSRVERTVNDIADAVVEKMKSDGFLKTVK